MKATMKHYLQPARFAPSSVLMLFVLMSLVTFGAAADVKAKPPITIAGLAGPWLELFSS